MRILLLVLLLVGGCVPYGAGYYGTAYYPAAYPAYPPAYPVYAPGPYTGGYAAPPGENCGTPEVFKPCVR
jgi:hypothetical protein